MIEITQLDHSAKHVGRWKVPNDFEFGREVLIAFSRKNGHAYLVAGKYEIHGHFIFKKTWSRSFSELSCDPIVFIRLRNLSQSDIEKLESYIEANEGIRESSCINYCMISLFCSLGIRVNTSGAYVTNLSDCLDNVLRNGMSRNGKFQKVDIYCTDNWSKKEIFSHFSKLEERFYWTHRISRLLGKLLFFMRSQHQAYYSKSKQLVNQVTARTIR